MKTGQNLTLDEILDKAILDNVSDVHLISSSVPIFRVNGRLTLLTSYPKLNNEMIQNLVLGILSPEQKELLINHRSIDFSYGYGGGDYGNKGRFRVNFYFQRNTLAAAFRLFYPKIRTIEELRLPAICHRFSELKQGLILVTGPTGQGKSTSLSAIINEINVTRSAHIVTIEDPIEYIYPEAKSIISQRELGTDSLSWNEALRSVMREDPDVILVGEMRDPESTASVISLAETGHLVFSTIHTNSASQTIDRIIDEFPDHQQTQIRSQLSNCIEGIISQRLIPSLDGGRVVATEVMLGTNAVKSNIREGKTHLIDSIIETSKDIGMIPLEWSLSELVKDGIISLDIARSYTLHEKELLRLAEIK